MSESMDLVGFGTKIMAALDKLGAPHGYYSVGRYGIQFELIGTDLITRVYMGPLVEDEDIRLSVISPVTYIVSEDLKRLELASKQEEWPDWANYWAIFDLRLK